MATNIIELDASVSEKESIAAYISIFIGNVRFVYIGRLPFDDFRYVPIEPGSAITMASVEVAIKIL